MDYEQIKKLMEDMGNSKLTDISIEFPDGIKISMKKGETKCSKKEEKPLTEETADSMKEAKKEDANKGNIIKAPMVGTFYAKPTPDSKPYVEIGQNVKKGDILCVIEAMKLLNEIESEFDGEIAEIFVSDGEMVDFGKPLFKIV